MYQFLPPYILAEIRTHDFLLSFPGRRGGAVPDGVLDRARGGRRTLADHQEPIL
jgi:hypothetical protein